MNQNKFKKNNQLGMNYSTASGRLVKDIIFNFINKTNNNFCFHCNKEMSRDNFSVEHKIPWLDSKNPTELFFDLNNIAFSHMFCNFSKARKVNKLSEEDKLKSRTRTLELKRQRARNNYTTENRRKKYLETGH